MRRILILIVPVILFGLPLLQKSRAQDVYIDITGIHVDITIPIYDENGRIIGYKNYSYGPVGNVFGGPGIFINDTRPHDWDPENHHDYVIDTAPYQDELMRQKAEELSKNPPDYNVLIGNTCVGQTTVILQAGEIYGPWYSADPWTGHGYDDWLEDWIDNVRVLKDQDIEGTGSSSSDDYVGTSSGGNDSGSSGGGNVRKPSNPEITPPQAKETIKIYPDGTFFDTRANRVYLGPGPKI